MHGLNLDRWRKVWLSRSPLQIRRVRDSVMIEINGVRGYLTEGDVVFLFNLAADLPTAGNYLEVGSWMGLSSILFANGLMANLNFNARVHCVDTWEGSAEHQDLAEVRAGTLYETFLQNVAHAQVEHFIRPIRKSSLRAACDWHGLPLDMIFIDGDHTTEACLSDIRAWLPHLAAGGRMLGHDAAPDSGVRRALEHFRSQTGIGFRVFEMPETHYAWELDLPNGFGQLHHPHPTS